MIILIEGNNYFESLREYKNQLRSFEQNGYATEELRPELENFDAQLDLTQNQGLFSTKVLYVLKDFDKLNPERAERVENAAKTVDILILHSKSFDKRKSFYKNVKKSGKVFSFSRLNGKRLEQWIVAKLNEAGVKLNGAARVELVL